jgi:type VI secretion system secreted protein VgrG
MGINAACSAASFGTQSMADTPPRELVEKFAWVEFRLVDPEGPLSGEEYILTDPNGDTHTGTVDEQGRARIEGIPAGRCKVEFPKLGYAVEVARA